MDVKSYVKFDERQSKIIGLILFIIHLKAGIS